MTAPALDLVDCVPYGVRLTAAACAQRFGFAPTLKWVRNVGSTDHIRYGHCLDCAAGKERAALVQITPKPQRGRLQLAPAPTPPREPAPQPKPSEGHMADGERREGPRRYEYRGALLTIGELAKTDTARAIGLSSMGIRKRLEAGYSVEEALTRPRQNARTEPSRAKQLRAFIERSDHEAAQERVEVRVDNRNDVDPVGLLRALGLKVEVLGRAPRGLLILLEES